MSKRRVRIPKKTQSEVLLANRHACCVCQAPQVQLHHVDGNPKNNDRSNIATLCLPHHDQASMQIGLTKKLQPDQVIKYKAEWEAKCSADIQALSRDRVRFYATVYKNPPRIRELLACATKAQREQAVASIQVQLEEDHQAQESDLGFSWNAVPGNDDLTNALLPSLVAGELWPSILPRVKGHDYDPDYPVDMSPPDGMLAFHGYDLYCQLAVRLCSLIRPPVPLEYLWSLGESMLIDNFAGCLVSFRETAIGKGIKVPRSAGIQSLGRVQFRVQREKRIFRAIMPIKNMYVFSDTSALNLQRSRVCGVGILEDAQEIESKNGVELHIGLKPLLIGMGGLGQSTNGFWTPEVGPAGSSQIF